MRLDVLKKATGEVKLYEEIPDEDLWQDGELNPQNVMHIIYHRVVKLGTWKLVRRVNES
jgi:hypothetical protein